ncbi:MAG TPA: family 78 glycoside hydrolase catalytic domain [Candidatus Hydrogenedentes bacterium]|nr:family 78 glycoside hydrolase catalytic domain [Candidatus Hydrogenedentota bacterium]
MRRAFGGLFFLSVAVLASAAESTITAGELRCDFRANPLGIEDAQPRLSWVVSGAGRGVVQTACQVMVASGPELLDTESPDLWDSGRVESAALHTRYAGTPLRSAQTACWRVRVWDAAGQSSPWSEIATWSMGLLEPSDWQARWIAGRAPRPVFEGAQWLWAPDEEPLAAAPGTRVFGTVLERSSSAPILSARLEVSADNEYRLYAGPSASGPVATKTGWEQAHVVDVAQLLQGPRTFIGFNVTNTGDAANPAGVIARLDIEYADGTSQTLVTDKTWRAGPKEGWDAALAESSQNAVLPAGWPPARELGPYGMEPWGEITRVDSDVMPIFRHEFTVEPKPVKRALAFVCGLGHFELALNGANVGDHVLDPGWTDYRDTCLYVPFDVTAMVREGPNALGVMLGNGMYNVTGGRYVKFLGSFGEPKLILELWIEYADGTVQRVVSDDSWTFDDGPIVFSCVYGGEDYDARRDQPGWDAPGFDDGGWKRVRVVEGPGGALRAQSAPPLTVARRVGVKKGERLEDGRYAAVLEENLSLRPVMTVTGPPGARVTIETAERIENPWPGHAYTCTLNGEGEETFCPRFTYFGFQFLLVSNVDLPGDAQAGRERPVLLELGADFITSSAPPVGAFQCEGPEPGAPHLFTSIDAMIDRSVRSNLQSVLTDCPHREKLGWLEVAHLMGPSILYRYDAHGLYRKICRDTTESQLDSGLVPDIAPEYTRFNGGFFESPEWGSASVQLPWLLYRWYGDDGILARQYDTMAKYTRYLASTRNEQGLARAGLGDWYDWSPEHGHRGESQHTPGELTATAMLFDNARIVAAVAAMQARETDAAEFRALAEQVRADFIQAYYRAGEETIATGSLASLAVALHFGLCPDHAREALLERLVAALESNRYRQTTGEVCFRYLLLALADAGRSDVIYRMLDRTDPPGYGCMLQQGLETLSEQWDRPGSSLNHCMFGHAQEWFTGYLLGIRQATGSAGFEHLRIEPVIVDGLSGAEGYFDSPRGRIAVSWKRRKPDDIALEVTIPGNTTAEIVLPTGSIDAIRESGVPLAEAPGIRTLEPGAKTAITTGSGRYQFTWPHAAAAGRSPS